VEPLIKTPGQKLSEFDKYHFYMASVQSPEADAEFLRNRYREIRGRDPVTLREDFCGTFALCCEWTKLGKKYAAIGVDIDPEPIEYGQREYLALLKKPEQGRVEICQADVLKSKLPAADISCSLNFSYFCFKDRQVLRDYFAQTLKGLKRGGIHVLDCFGGAKCHEPNEEETFFEDSKFSYFWDQDTFNPINNYSQFYIHYKRKGEKKRERVFSYDWRMWSIPELKDILLEVGYRDVGVYWEGTDEDGDGNGLFTRTDDPREECEAWVAYIVAEK
jgi:hypothetical protein